MLEARRRTSDIAALGLSDPRRLRMRSLAVTAARSGWADARTHKRRGTTPVKAHPQGLDCD